MPPKKARKYSKKYSKFVMGIATSPNKMEKFLNDPSGVMKKAGLTRAEMSIIRSGKTSAILARVDPALYKEVRPFHVHVHVELIGIVRPNMVSAIILKKTKKKKM